MRSIRIAVVGLALSFIFSGLVLTIPPTVSALTIETWNQTSGNLASTDANWLDGTKPVAGADTSIVFDGTSTAACTWDLAITVGNFSILTGYTGIVTQAANFGVSSFFMEAGTLTGSTSYVLTDSGSFTRSGGTVTNNVLRLVMTGDSTSIACSGTLYDFTASANVTVSTSALGTRHSLTIGSGKTLTVPAGTGLNWQTIGGGSLTNDGTIAGASTFYVYTYNLGATVTFGVITLPTVYLWLQSGGSSNTITLGASTTLSACHLKMYSAQSGQSLTLNTNNYALSVLRLTIETGGVLTAGSSTITVVNHNWDSSAGTFNAGTSTIIMQGVSKTVKTSSTQAFYNFRSSANPCITASNISVSHNLTVDEGMVLTIGSTFILDFNCSGGGTYSNAGMITSPGTMVYSFDVANAEMTIGTVNAAVWIRALDTATSSCTLDLATDTIFGRSLYLYSESSDLMILDARGVAVQVTMGFVNGTNGMVYYTDWSDSTPYIYDIYVNGTHYYARNRQNGTIESSSPIAAYADDVVQYAINATRVGGEVHFTDGTFVFEAPNDFYVGGWNFSVQINYAYQLIVSGDASATLKFRQNLQVAVGKGVAIFLTYGTCENVIFSGLNFEWSQGLVASYSSAIFFSNAIKGMTVEGCSFVGLNWSLWQDGTEFGLGGDIDNHYTDNTFIGGWRGMALHNIQSRTVISGNTFVNIGSALMIDSVEDVLIIDNTFLLCGDEYCIDIWDRCDNITVSQNYFEGAGTSTYGVILDQVTGKLDVSNVTIHDNAFVNFTGVGISVEHSNLTTVTSNAFLNTGHIISDEGFNTTTWGNINYTVNPVAMGGYVFTHNGFAFNDYTVDIQSTIVETKNITMASEDGTVTEFQLTITIAEASNLSFQLGGDTLVLAVSSSTWLNLSADWGPMDGVEFETSQSMSCIVSTLDATLAYRVYRDGVLVYQQLDGFTTLTFETTGGGRFEIVSWELQPPGVRPTAAFEYRIQGDTVYFTDLSYNGPVVWIWNFGDGYGSTDQNPTHEYKLSRVYTVTLIVYDSYGKSSTASTVIEITSGPDNTIDETDTGWNLWVSDELTLGISAAGLIVSGGILFFTGMYVKSLPIITPKGRKVLGILMVLLGLYFFIFVDNNWLG